MKPEPEWLDVECSDCGCHFKIVNTSLAKGSSVREPGEPVCGSCSSARIRLVRKLALIPGNLQLIKANRMKGSR